MLFGKKPAELKLRIKSHKPVATSIVGIELVSANGKELPSFTAGSHLDLHLGKDGSGQELIRQYSLANDPSETDRYQLGVLLEPKSRGGSEWVHNQLKEGMEITTSLPRNQFPLNEKAKHSILVAGGIGVTPILSMAHRLHSLGQSFDFYYVMRSIDRAAFYETMQKSGFAKNVKLHCDEGDPSKLFQAEKLLVNNPGSHLYVCGPGGFMGFILGSARKNGWSEDSLHVEYFGAKPVEAGTQGTFKVRAKKSNKEIEVAANQSIAKALQLNGIAVPTSCENGICGTCLTPVLEGTPDHKDSFQTNAEKAKNNMMTVCCSRSKSPMLVLDI